MPRPRPTGLAALLLALATVLVVPAGPASAAGPCDRTHAVGDLGDTCPQPPVRGEVAPSPIPVIPAIPAPPAGPTGPPGRGPSLAATGPEAVLPLLALPLMLGGLVARRRRGR